jgi:serine phosphatase RsbU (regulator of sigma subunit)
VVILIVSVFILTSLLEVPGPTYLPAILVAAIWFGPWVGLGTGAVCACLYVVSQEIHGSGPAGLDSEAIVPALVRLAIYAPSGFLVGSLSRSRIRLEREVAARERELTELRTIQETLAPSEPPPRPGLELATCYLPAEAGVAGDFYLVADGPNGSTVLALGDVAGRGLDAARRAWFVRTVLTSSAEFTADPSQLLELANYSLIEESGRSDKFVTAACLVYDPATGNVAWAVAGHQAPLLLDRGAPPSNRTQAGIPLGLRDNVGCTTASFPLEPGGGLLLYTDGLTEARPSAGAKRPDGLFGEDRVARMVAELAGEPPDRVVNELRAAAERFSGGRLSDDLCLLALRVSEEPDSTSVC